MQSQEQIKKLRKTYPKGTKIRLIFMKGEPQMQNGLTGKVSFVDDAGQIHVNWNSGSNLALLPETDLFEIIQE